MDRQCETVTAVRVLAARSELTERMAALERRVTGSVEGVADTVTDAAATVRSTIHSATDNVKRVVGTTTDNVRAALDVPHHVRSRPWAAMTAAALAGFAAGFIPSRLPRSTAVYASASSATSGMFGDLWSIIRRELRSLGETAVHA